jgi:autotransporter-associated beta strand protein
MRKVWITAAALLLPSVGVAQVQINQTFIPQGPAPGYSPQGFTDTGAVEAVLPDPALGTNTMFIGATNGGIWRTDNGGASWTPKTDNLASLSIASLGLDPTDPSGKTLIAGSGATSNGQWKGFPSPVPPEDCAKCNTGRGGPLDGLLYSTDGGNTWTSMGEKTLGGMSVVGVAARGSTILAATFEPQDATKNDSRYGLYKSTDGGHSFTKESGLSGTGLPAGPVTSLVSDPANPNIFYAAVMDPTKSGYQTAVYKRDLTVRNGQWSKVFDTTNYINYTTPTLLRVATGPDGSVAVGVANFGSDGWQVTALFWSKNPSNANAGSWTNLPSTWVQPSTPHSWPDLLSEDHQAFVNFAIAIDPKNSNRVYVSGDSGAGGNGAPVYGIDVNSQTAMSIVGPNHTSNGTVPHSDSRAIAFNSYNQMIFSSDGGVYLQTDPQSPLGQWQGLNNSLEVGEPYSVVYGANAKLLLVARQDNGVAVQSAQQSTTCTQGTPNSPLYCGISIADGTNAAVSDKTFRQMSVFYSSSDHLDDFTRSVVDAQGNITSVPVTCNGGNCSQVSKAAYGDPFVLNRVYPKEIAIAIGENVYTATDGAAWNEKTSVNLTLNEAGAIESGGQVNVIAYGVKDRPDAVLVGVKHDASGELYFGLADSPNAFSKLQTYKGAPPSSLVFEPHQSDHFYVADGLNLWSTGDGGKASFAKNQLPSDFVGPAALEFIDNNGVEALLLGGRRSKASAQSPILVADNFDPNGKPLAWSSFGSGLPNTLVSQMYYNSLADVLAAPMVGRGVWTLYDVTSYFPQATALQFGLANNDSQPDASFLTDGTSLDGKTFPRPLNKYGTGTLTIAGDATYTGGTTIFGGTLQLGTGSAGGGIHGAVAFCNDSANALCDPSNNKTLVFYRPGSYTFDGAISGPGQVVQFGVGTTTLTGTNTYSGPTHVLGGELIVNGSIANSSLTAVGYGAALSGTGTVGALTIGYGGLFAPGSGASGGFMTVAGDLTFNPGSTYLVTLNGAASTAAQVQGTASLAGTTVAAAYAPGSSPKTKYTILTATGGGLGGANQFSGLVSSLPVGFKESLSYDNNDIYLNLSANLGGGVLLPYNQQGVANALSLYFNAGGFLPPNFLTLFNLNASTLPSTLATLTGEASTGTEQTSFRVMNQFFDQVFDAATADGSSGEASSRQAMMRYAEDEPLGAPKAITMIMPDAGKSVSVPIVVTRPLWGIWANSFGGYSYLSGDPYSVGSHSFSGSAFGLASGIDYRPTPGATLGLALAGGGANWGLAQGLGGGQDDFMQASLYGQMRFGSAYVASAVAFGNHWMDASRSASSYALTSNFQSQNYAGRIEAGLRDVALLGFSPYVAAQEQVFVMPGFNEKDPTASGFALSYWGRYFTDARAEVGARFERAIAAFGPATLALRGRAAYVHDWVSESTLAAVFAVLPGTGFGVEGARLARNAAVISLGPELRMPGDTTLFAKFDGELSDRGQAYFGRVGFRWGF